MVFPLHFISDFGFYSCWQWFCGRAAHSFHVVCLAVKTRRWRNKYLIHRLSSTFCVATVTTTAAATAVSVRMLRLVRTKRCTKCDNIINQRQEIIPVKIITQVIVHSHHQLRVYLQPHTLRLSTAKAAAMAVVTNKPFRSSIKRQRFMFALHRRQAKECTTYECVFVSALALLV